MSPTGCLGVTLAPSTGSCSTAHGVPGLPAAGAPAGAPSARTPPLVPQTGHPGMKGKRGIYLDAMLLLGGRGVGVSV